MDPVTTAAAEALFARLRPGTVPGEPRVVDLSRDARRAFARWFDENAALVASASGLAAGCFAKYPGQVARVALVLHCLRHPDDHDRRVNEGTVLDAIAVVEYFQAHLARILPAFGAAAPAKGAGLAGRVARVLQRDGGDWVARTELHRSLGGVGAAADLTTALQDLADEGLAEGRSVDTGARQREEWRWLGAGGRRRKTSRRMKI